MPIRSPRRIYELTGVTRPVNDQPDAFDPPTDEDPSGSEENLFVKMKEGVGQYLGLTPLEWNDARFEANFATSADGQNLNRDATFHRNIGGFRALAYTFISETVFSITETYFADGATTPTVETNPFKTFTIGFPVGARVWQVKRWIGTVANFDNIRAMRTPKGRRIDLYNSVA